MKSFTKPMNKQNQPKISIRPYEIGDEDAIIKFVNFSYSQRVEDMESWNWKYIKYPTFKKDNVFIVEADNKIVGYRALFLRELSIFGNRFTTASLGSTAVHPDFRGYGIYSRLHVETLQAAVSQGAGMVITWNSKGSITYKHNKKTDFVEVKQPAYIKIINYRKVLETEIRAFITSNNRARDLFEDLKHELYIGIEGQASPIAITNLLSEDSSSVNKKEKRVLILFTESAIPLLLKLRKGDRFQRVFCLLQLILFRRLKIRCNSPIILLRFIWKGVKLIV